MRFCNFDAAVAGEEISLRHSMCSQVKFSGKRTFFLVRGFGNPHRVGAGLPIVPESSRSASSAPYLPAGMGYKTYTHKWIEAIKNMNSINSDKKELSIEQREELLRALKDRFETNMNRHKGLEWAKVQARLEASTEKLWALNEMERTGGEPDVVGHDKKTSEYIFYDCSAESPEGRRSVCYDREGQEARKSFKPKDNAMDMAAALGMSF
jgi:hypothetical protein